MITWMQKHKKWLIVTIWISTIAFVGAGFVGWGSYDYGKSNSTVAMVGDTEIPMNDLQNEYSAIYNQYQQMLGKSFNQELAKQLKIEDMALERVIQKNLIMNFAKDFGLVVTDREVAKELIKIESFFKDGKFDKNTYMSLLQQNRKSISEFEAQLKQDLLVQKVQKILDTPLSSNELKNINKLFYSEDKISIAILDSNNMKIDVKEVLLKEYWEKNKSNYKSKSGYQIEFTLIENIDNKTKREMKKIALKTYLKLKKDEEKFAINKVIFRDSVLFSNENMDKIRKSKIGDIMNSIYNNGQYIIIKLVKNIKPKILPYKDVKDEITNAFINDSKITILNKQKDNLIKNFSGEEIGYISRTTNNQIKDLEKNEVSQLIKAVFSSKSTIDSVTLEDKIIVFKILDSKLSKYNQNNDNIILSNLENIKTNLITTMLIEKLKNKYPVKSFIRSK